MIPLSIVAPFVLLALAALPGQAAVPERLQAIFPGPAELRTVHGAADLVKLLQPADFTPAGIRDRGLPPKGSQPARRLKWLTSIPRSRRWRA